jgi:hypothetical protein
VKRYGNNVKVSGGLFLYPRQSFIFLSIIRYLETIFHGNETTIHVCETGFGAGHSAALFLHASERVKVTTFDNFDRSYQIPILKELQHDFGGHRIHSVMGDTCQTVPKYFSENSTKSCDLIHGSSLCSRDMPNLILPLRPYYGIVTSTAMPSLRDDSVYFGSKVAQWQQLRDAGCLSDIHCWREDSRILSESYVFAKRGSPLNHAFCVAYHTGKCSTSDSHSLLPIQDLPRWNFSTLCVPYQVPIPEVPT